MAFCGLSKTNKKEIYMKVLLVIDSFFTGGAEFSTLSYFSYLKNKGIEIEICKLKKMNPEYNPSDLDLDDTIIHTLSNSSFRNNRNELKKIIKNFKPDIIHSVLFKSNILVRSISVFTSSFIHIESLVNLTYHVNRLNEPGITKLKLGFYQLLDFITLLKGTQHFHANGHTVAQHYHEKLLIPKSKITVIHRGRKPNTFIFDTTLKSSLNINQNKFVLINIGRQEFQKGQDVLIDAIALLDEQIKSKIHVLIVGREGKSTSELVQRIAEYKLNDNITFLGHRSDVSELLKIADLFVFPSRFEGLPGVLIEAEAASLPIICTKLPMMLEVIEENKNALTFELDNSNELASCISKIFLNSSLRNEFGIRSAEIFKEKFEIETIHAKMLHLYSKLVKG